MKKLSKYMINNKKTIHLSGQPILIIGTMGTGNGLFSITLYHVFYENEMEYDAITFDGWQKKNYVLILNRTKVIVKE